MNFIEAVQALKEGRCEEIMRTQCGNSTRFRLHNKNHICGSIDTGMTITNPHFYLADDWKLVNPVKQYEEVPVTRYLVIDSNGYEQIYKEDPTPCIYPVLKLEGTQKVEVKPKVKHRVSLSSNYIICKGIAAEAIGKENVKFYAEWEE